MNDQLYQLYLREKQQDMLREAERQRMLAAIRPASSSILNTALLKLGDIFISLGKRIQSRPLAHLKECCQQEAL